ncbi:MAG TPA: signal peptide peptidase SppA [Thermoanaerobaculia bacterium]|nr:signal peptide peptidase SppA [Thermoanaerobaculia bacterium]
MSEFEPEKPDGARVSPPAPAQEPAGEDTRAPQVIVEVPAPRKSRTGMFFIGALSGCAFVVLGGLLLVLAVAGSRGGGELSLSTQKIAIITIEGEIFESRATIEAIHRYANNATVKGIVMRINSPGGAIAPSQEIYSEILKTKRKSGKPFVASFDTVAASGGFYIAAACDRIVANPGSITGSIGVILQWVEIEDLLRWARMNPETITSGALKAAGSPFKELSEQERQYLQRVVVQLHTQFVKAVAAGRRGKITEEQVQAVADGRVFTGEEAVTLKLVDELGNLDDAVNTAAKLAGIKGDPATIYPRRRQPTLIDLLSDGGADSMIERIVNRRAARFLYKW